MERDPPDDKQLGPLVRKQVSRASRHEYDARADHNDGAQQHQQAGDDEERGLHPPRELPIANELIGWRRLLKSGRSAPAINHTKVNSGPASAPAHSKFLYFVTMKSSRLS